MTTRPDAIETKTPATAEGERFDTPGVTVLAGAHFVHDIYPSFIGPLLPLLIEKHGMSMAIAGGLATLNRWPSVAQPFMGYWADRYDARALVVLGPLVTGVALSLLGSAPNYAVLVALLLIAGVSSAAFHPTSSAMMTRLSGRHWGRAASFYMTGGELGRALGPAFIVAIVAAFGFENTLVAAIPGAGMAVLLYGFARRQGPRIAQATPAGLREALRSRGRALLLLASAVLFRGLVVASFQVFFPTFLKGEGADLVYAGLALTVYEIGGVTGAFLGGPLSDRFGRRTTMALSQLTGGLVLSGALLFAQQPLGLVFLALGGLLALSAGPVQLTLAQELLPNNRSMASGIVMFLSFESTVVATIATGLLADAVGLGNALRWTLLASMLSIPFTLLLPETRRAR